MPHFAFRPLSGGLYETVIDTPLGPLSFSATVGAQGRELLLWAIEVFPVEAPLLPVGWPYLRHVAVGLARRAAGEGFDVLILSGR